MARWLMNPAGIQEDVGLVPGLAQVHSTNYRDELD